MTPMDERGEHELRSYGRRRGRKPSARQAALWAHIYPRQALPVDSPPPEPLARLFAVSVSDVWLEIGFGGGEHLIWQAKANPQVGLIGCEPFQDGIVKALAAIEAEKLGNVRLNADDARPILRWLPAASIGRAFILFPDPWPKKRHHKRRLVSEPTLGELARVMRPGAELRIATDIGDYARWTLGAVQSQGSFAWTAQGPADWRQRGPDWPPTRYEQKALRDGRRCTYLRFQRAP
jgi:tRNA (guanine-N7-)-methyltransferase